MSSAKQNQGAFSAAKGFLAKIGLAAKGGPKAASEAPPPDPAKILFPAGGADDASAILSAELKERLETSADDIARRQALLRESAIDLRRTSDARDRGERQLTIWGMRLLIGAGWFGLGAWLSQTALKARAEQQELAAGMEIGDVEVLGEVFTVVGGFAGAAALLMIMLVFISGNGTNDRLRRRGEAFGDNLAAMSRKFNSTLKYFREAIAGKQGRTEEIVPAVSQAHLTALEARVFFNEIGFLTTFDEDAADKGFKKFLTKYAPTGFGFGPVDVVLGAVLGGIIGLGLGYRLFAPESTADEPTTALAIMQYPWAWQALLLGGGAYVIIGTLVEALYGALSGGRPMTRARKAALDSVRSAYTAQEAPLASEVVRQVEDVVEILRARLGQSGVGSTLSPAEIASQSPAYAAKSRMENATARFDDPDLETPAWRRRDSSVKFVDAGFSAAPATWRTDAYAKKLEGEPGSKRDRSAPKKPSRD